jgi:hypothetical protein
LIALEVNINGNKTIIAGQDDLSVLAANVTAVGQLGSKSNHKKEAPDLFCSVGGLEQTTGTHPSWIQHHLLSIGDTVTIKLIETNSPDPYTHIRQGESKESDSE